jgi:tRNA pseudouridine38-40 synthase
VRLLAVVEYDGTDFSGFQLQAHHPARHRTVQAELERAIAECTGEAVRVVSSGRTDTGVHARGQVVHFDSSSIVSGSCRTMMRALNAHLPGDVKVRELRIAPVEFHARFSAVSRTYCYRIFSSDTPSPLLRRYTFHVRHRLSLENMAEAASSLVGTHDFVAFASQQQPGSTVRRLIGARVVQTWAVSPSIWHTSVDRIGAPSLSASGDCVDIQQSGSDGAPRDGDARIVEIVVEASGFLRHMMRRIAGTLVRVGGGRLDPADVSMILASKRKDLAGPTAPACGLCLENVKYQAVIEENAV